MAPAHKSLILIKSDLNRTGGLEKYAWKLAQDFCTLGIPTTLLTTGRVIPPFSHPSLNIVSFPIAHSMSLLQLIHFDKACGNYLKNHSASFVLSLDRTHSSTHIRAGNGVHASYLKHRKAEEGKLKALSFYLNPLHRTILSIEKKTFEDPRLQILFTNSHMVQQEILSRYTVQPEKIRVIHNGVEWHAMQTAFDPWKEQKQTLLKNQGLDPSSFHFLFIGHNYRRKGLDKLLHALAELKERDFQLSVIGKEKNLPFYRQKAMSLGLFNKVFFFAPSSNILSFYQCADVLVIPSLYDPFANVTVEALAMGLFVLSSKTNGGHEILNAQSGIVIENIHDPSCFADALRQAMRHPKTPTQAERIRSMVRHLDFSTQLRLMTQAITS